MQDTIDDAAVPEGQQLDRDEDPTDPEIGSAALEDGDDTDDLEAVYADPGDVVEEDLG